MFAKRMSLCVMFIDLHLKVANMTPTHDKGKKAQAI
jgi:hypothetical protein